MTDIHFIVAHPEAARVLVPLWRACTRRGARFSAFFTGGGTEALVDPFLKTALDGALEAVACHDSWSRTMGDGACPVRLGSQTNNSELTGRAVRVVSL